MKKHIVFIFAMIVVLLLGGCKTDVVLREATVYRVGSDIRSLEIQINAADFRIQQAEAFSVESNLRYLSVSEKDGVLIIREDVKTAVTYTDAMLTLYIPAGTVFEEIDITTGAAKLTADTLSTESLRLQLGAGAVRIEYLDASREADIEGGAGKIAILGGTLNNLELEMGVGELDLTAALRGDCDLHFGVGTSNLTLIGSRDDYRVDIEKGIGRVTVDGKEVSDFGSSGSGANCVEIEGGIGAIDLKFQKVD